MGAWSFLITGLFVITFSNISFATEQLYFGRFHSRALFNASFSKKCGSPLVILVPGSGANGPEEMVPGLSTLDGIDHSIFSSFSEGLRRGGVATLAIGKPGVEYFKSWNRSEWFYDPSLFDSLVWQDLVDNLKDAFEFAKTLPCVDPNQISVLGHSEGTQVAADFALDDPDGLRSLILVGFSGENLATTLDWQFFRRPIDSWLKPDLDLNFDGLISRADAAAWPEFKWDWNTQDQLLSLVEIEETLRSDLRAMNKIQELARSHVWKDVFERTPLYSQIAKLKQDLVVFTGELDVQTRPEDALLLRAECEKHGKKNCKVTLVLGLGHAMSSPKGPRMQKWLDATLGPVSDQFMDMLKATASQLCKT